VVIAVAFAIVGTSPLWRGRPEALPPALRRIGAAAAVLPLLFAVYLAGQPNYGPQYGIVFGFLWLVDAGLLLLVWRGCPWSLHAASGGGALLFFVLVGLGLREPHRYALLIGAMLVPLMTAKKTRQEIVKILSEVLVLDFRRGARQRSLSVRSFTAGSPSTM